MFRFPHCDCIQLGYSVHAVAKVGEMMLVMSMMINVCNVYTHKNVAHINTVIYIYVFYFESQTSIYQNMRLDQYNREGLS